MGVGHAEGPEQCQQVEALLLAELTHETQVQERQPTGVGVQHDVAGVWVGVEEAVDEQLLDGRPDERPRHPLAVDGGVQEIRPGGLDTRHEVHREDAVGAQLPMDGRHPDALDRRQHVGQSPGVIGLHGVVELLEDAVRELLHQADRIEVTGQPRPGLRHLRELGDDAEIGPDLGLHVGTLHLDHDLAAVLQRGPVHLRQGRCRERLGLDGSVEVLRLCSELGPDDPPGALPRERRDRALELVQLGAPLLGQGVRTAAGHLAELHVRRARAAGA